MPAAKCLASVVTKDFPAFLIYNVASHDTFILLIFLCRCSSFDVQKCLLPVERCSNNIGKDSMYVFPAGPWDPGRPTFLMYS